jgi:glycosyltransferase involved in cell wall biosynthesis
VPTAALRVLVVSPYATLGGAESWLLRLLDATDRLLPEVVLLQDGPFRSELERRGLHVTVHQVGARPVDLPAPIAWLTRELRRRRPDVVLANGVKAQLVAGPAARLAAVPVVWAKHDHSFDRLAPYAGRLADAVVAAAPELGEAVGRADVVVVPPPRPDREPASRAEARRFFADLGVPLGDAPTLVLPGRLVPYKGVDDAIEALTRPAAAGWRLVVIGDDDASSPGEGERLRGLAADAGVSERVRFVGRVPDVAHWLAAFDALGVFTKPGGRRTPGKEGFGTSAFEAMCAGVPVVGVTGGAVVRRLAGVAGRGVPPADPAAIGAALGELSDPEVRRAAGEAARELVADHPTAAETADLLAGTMACAAARAGAGKRTGEPLTIVVPVYNEGAGVDRIAADLLAQLGPYDEVVLVDDGSRDDTGARAARLAAEHPGRIVFHQRERNGGVGAARNTGVTVARHPRVAFTDAGCELDPTWVEGMRGALAESPPPSFVTGGYRASADGVVNTAMAVSCYPDIEEARRPTLLVRCYGALFGRTFDATRPAGRSIAFTKDAYAEVGGFREDMAATEDIDFSRAIAARGLRCVLATDASLTWLQAPSLRDSARMYVKYGRGDSASADRQAIARDLARAAAYAVGPALLVRGGRAGRSAALLGAAAYLSLPMVRAARRPRPVLVAAAVPVTVATKDLAKAYGCVSGLLRP